MINLIPSSAKRNVAIEYWIRVLSVCLFITSGLLAVTTLLLLPVYVLVNYQINIYAKEITKASAEVNEYNLSSTALIQSSLRASLILKLREEQNFSALLKQFTAIENPNVTINSFTFSRKEGALEPILITGKALTRQSLADFRESLLKDATVEKVFLPISNLAQDKDITFTITVTMKPLSS
jgi:hypothetical protein